MDAEERKGEIVRICKEEERECAREVTKGREKELKK